MIDPLTALAGIQAAVALIKKVSKTVDDVSSLGPVLGKYFDAKSTASKAMVESRNSGKKSSMGTAIQIEMALDQAAQFEKELQLLFMQTGKIDVWNKIKARSAAMDVESAHAARRERAAGCLHTDGAIIKQRELPVHSKEAHLRERWAGSRLRLRRRIAPCIRYWGLQALYLY